MIKPYVKPRPHREMCWLIDHQTVLHESGVELDIADIDKQMSVWSSTDLIMRLLNEGHGEALTWDGAAIRWAPTQGATHWPVSVLRMVVPQDNEQAIDGLQDWRDWLEAYGAGVASSVGGSGFSLLKATLQKPLYTSRGTMPPISYTLGGRQEWGPQTPPHVFTGAVQHWDMQAAYAKTLGELRYGGSWEEIPPYTVPVVAADPSRMLYVRAKVRIPEAPHPWLGPLPLRARHEKPAAMSLFVRTLYPTGRDMQGCWTWQELVQAERAGCKLLRIVAAWVHHTPPDMRPFLPWLRAVEHGRGMTGFASALAKSTGNSTWGQFAVRRDGSRAVLRITDNGTRRLSTPLPMKGGNPSQRAYELAEYICGSIRAKLYAGIVHTGDDLICAHTDGLWGVGPLRVEGWRLKDEATQLRFLDAQVLAYRRYGATDDTYVYAGVKTQEAARQFEADWKRRTHGH